MKSSLHSITLDVSGSGVVRRGPTILGPVDHIRFLERPPLVRPAVIAAFRGWNDGGEAATVAANYLVQHWNARPFAELDAEEFFDFQVTRPTVRLEGGMSRVIDWPVGRYSFASPGGRDVVTFSCAEPNVRWRTFTNTFIDMLEAIASDLFVTFGAFLTDVPHSRPVPVVGSSYSEETAQNLGLARSQYEGPTGIVGVLHDASNRAGVPSVSLWAAVPHYLPSAPNPKAALALVERATALLEVEVDTAPLAEAAVRWEQGVDRLVQESDELRDYVGRLESAADEAAPQLLEGPMPSGEAIAAELERFLREQGGSRE